MGRYLWLIAWIAFPLIVVVLTLFVTTTRIVRYEYCSGGGVRSSFIYTYYTNTIYAYFFHHENGNVAYRTRRPNVNESEELSVSRTCAGLVHHLPGYTFAGYDVYKYEPEHSDSRWRIDMTYTKDGATDHGCYHEYTNILDDGTVLTDPEFVRRLGFGK